MQPLAVAPVADLPDELIDQIAPVSEDQDPARAGGLDEAHRRNRLARPGGVLEPEPLGRVGILGLLVELRAVVLVLVLPVLRLLVLGLVVVIEVQLGLIAVVIRKQPRCGVPVGEPVAVGGGAAIAGAGAVACGAALGFGQKRGQGA